MIIYDYRVGDFMTKNVRAVSEDTTVYQAAELMAKHKIGSVVIMKKNIPVGIVTDTDIVRKLVAKAKDPKKVLVKDIMTKNVITVSPETTLREASMIMAVNRVRRLPVIDKKKGLVGIVTETDLTRVISNSQGLSRIV